jgi:hypothetical protein
MPPASPEPIYFATAEDETDAHQYVLDVSRVDATEMRDAVRVLRRMNFEGNFALDIAI